MTPKDEAQPVGVGPLGDAQLGPAATALASAFADDPFIRYVFSDAESRPRLLTWHYSTLLHYGRLYGRSDAAVTPAGAVVGAAVWLPTPAGGIAPEERMARMERVGLRAAPGVLGQEVVARLATVVGHLEQRRQRQVPAAHWYLPVVGVAPDYRRRGLGAGLLDAGLGAATRAGVPAYLEVFAAQALPFYRRLGFEIVGEDAEPVSGLAYRTLLRVPPA